MGMMAACFLLTLSLPASYFLSPRDSFLFVSCRVQACHDTFHMLQPFFCPFYFAWPAYPIGLYGAATTRYKAGVAYIAGNMDGHHEAVFDVFACLDMLEARLSRSR